MKQLILVIVLIFLNTNISATAQAPDEILIEGKEYSLNTNPLTRYIKSIEWEVPDRALGSSGNWRGHIAHWEIKNSQLILTDITILVSTTDEKKRKRVSILKELFPNGETLASWYSGALIIPDGEMREYVHMGYGSTYEKYQIIAIKKGGVVSHKKLTYEEFLEYRDKKFKQFMTTDFFKTEFDDLVNGEHKFSEEDAIGFLMVYFAERYLSM